MSAAAALKAVIRKETLAKRDCLADGYRKEASDNLVARVDELNIPLSSVVAGFYPIKSEIDVRPLLAALAKDGHVVCLPVVIDKETIIFRQLRDNFALVKTGFGTYGPGEDAPEVAPDFILLPLAAFDAHGNRIGYGAGFYDRAIARLRSSGIQPRLIGVAFECQRVDRAPAESHDVPLDGVLTENGLTRFGD